MNNIKVYVLYRDIDAEIIGVYASVDAAVAAAKPKRGDDTTLDVGPIEADGTPAYIDAGGYMHFVFAYEVQE